MINVLNIIFLIGAAALLAGSFVIINLCAMCGEDIRYFDSLRRRSPTQYRRLKWISRTYGPLVILVCLSGIVSTPFLALDPDNGWLIAIGSFVVSIIYLWFSIRWFIWSLGA